MTSLPMRIIDDLKLLIRTPGALVRGRRFRRRRRASHRMFPEQRGDGGGSAPAAAAAGAGRAGAAVGRAIEAAGRISGGATARARDGAERRRAVVIVKFNDYQCPGCGQTYRDYKPVLAKWAKQTPGKVKFITKDYPLERAMQPVRRPGPALWRVRSRGRGAPRA